MHTGVNRGLLPAAAGSIRREVDTVRIPVREPLHYVFADLMASKDTVKILADLNKGYPFASNTAEERLHEALGEDNLDITKRAIQYISEGKIEELGKLMTEAQAIFDEKVAPMCPEELTSPVLHETLNDPVLQDYIYGGKGVGSQGDGTIQFLARNEETQQQLFDYLTKVKGMTSYKLTLNPNSGIRKAIIPVAGFGTRLYPQTRGVKKEFCPVLDRDGLIKPVILILLEECMNSGIEEICLIINPEEKHFYEDYFEKPLSISHYESLPDRMKEYEVKIREIGEKIHFAFQIEQKGFGHAVYQAMDFAAGDPVLLMLGDTIYQSSTEIPCAKQLIDAFDIFGKPMVALQSVPVENVGSYGIFAGTWEDAEEKVMKVAKIKEKPSPDYAADYLRVSVKQGDKSCYAAFGSYILTREVFEELEIMSRINEQGNLKSEVELTEALEHVMKKDSLMGYVIDGKSYDMGNARAYREAFINYAGVL